MSTEPHRYYDTPLPRKSGSFRRDVLLLLL
jgi:hypothetical protein